MQTVSETVLGASLTGYLHDTMDGREAFDRRPAAIVCTGGAYAFLSPLETDPPALALLAAGFQVFVLSYATKERAGALLPLRQLAETVCLIRKRSEEWRVLPERILVMGFSAGGHLAASLGCLWNHPDLHLQAARPNALALGYPVITMEDAFTHKETREHVAGQQGAARRLLSLEHQVGEQLPPVFLWHTADDASVPVQNSLLFADALSRYHIPFELHIYPSGIHGSSMCTEEVGTKNPAAQSWFSHFVRFASDVLSFPLSYTL